MAKVSVRTFQSPTHKEKLSLQSFHITGLIAEGSYAEVYEAIELRTNQKVAIKKLYKETINQSQKHSEVYVERHIMKEFSQKHPGIISFIGSFQDSEFLYFVTEHCPYGDLGLFMVEMHQALSTKDNASVQLLIKTYVYQLAQAIAFFHSEGVAHLDIKPKNIVIDKEYNLKLIDFATCFFFDESKQPKELGELLKKYAQVRPRKVRKLSGDSNVSDTSQSSPGSPFKGKFVGTPEYVSPEMLNNSRASKEADLWALGCIIYEFYYGHQPFTDLSENAIFNNILQLKFRNNKSSIVPKDVQDLITKLLVLNPMDRLGAKDVQDLFAHPYFKQVLNYEPWLDDVPMPDQCKHFYQELYAKQSMQSVLWGMHDSKPQCESTVEQQIQKSERNRLKTIIEEMEDACSPFTIQQLKQNSVRQLQDDNIIPAQSNDHEGIVASKSIGITKSIGFIYLQRWNWFCMPQVALLCGYVQPPCLELCSLKGVKSHLTMDASVTIRMEGCRSQTNQLDTSCPNYQKGVT